MNKQQTIVERPFYMDIDDPKNFWYLDAEKFELNFPLVYTYRSFDPKVWSVRYKFPDFELFRKIYNLFNVIAEYFSFSEEHSALIFERKVLFDDVDHYDPIRCSDYFIFEAERNIFNSALVFDFSEVLGNYVYYRLLVIAPISSLSEFKSRFIVPYEEHPDKIAYRYNSLVDYGQLCSLGDMLPYLQLVVTKDWDLVKRYLFFMIRNHQYYGSWNNEKATTIRLSWNPENYVNGVLPAFVYGFGEMKFCNTFNFFPRNFRFNYDKFGKVIPGKEDEEKEHGFIEIYYLEPIEFRGQCY